MSTSVFPETARKKPAKIYYFHCSFMFVSNKESWLVLVPWVSLDVIGGFFLPFDASMDIFHIKLNLGKVRLHALHQFAAVKVSRVTASIIIL